MKGFELPTNIKQIGSVSDGLKIYVEDYVCTYLRQFAESGGHTEKVAFLVGKYMVIDGSPYVFVSGAIQGKHSEFADNMESFTDASYDYAAEELDKHFNGCEIVGWMQSQPGYGIYLNPAYADYHMGNFTRPYHLLFVMDPVEKLNLFYTWNKQMDGIAEAGGYFVYYDQNKGMQEYMAANRINRAKSPIVKDLPKETPPAPKEVVEPPQPTTRLKLFDEPKNPANTTKIGRGTQPMGGLKTTTPITTERKEGRSIEDMRRLSNLLVGLCAVLFVVSFIMGAGLLQSDGRINALESAIVTMDNNNILIADQIRQLSAVAAFAPQDLADNISPTDEHTSPTQTIPTTNLTPPLQPPAEPDTTPITEPITDPQTQPPTEAPTTTTAIANVPQTYIIQPGDSLLQISRMFFGDSTMVNAIMEINGITDPNTIGIGQEILLPQQ
ncbi:MAG: LysM peptidoglycan-binding domain-containing protein [Defluviitaleaceae bacterium]|nr:LysM peptidoglycan-binding domain-containing protein [Defluviitaleaceae bacterium]